MTEEMKDQDKPDDGQSPTGEEPQVFSVKKDINGYKLNRRGFLTGAAVTATTAVLGVAISSQTDNLPAADEVQPVPGEQLELDIEMTGMTILPAAATFERIWKITNKSAFACQNAILKLSAKENPAQAQVFQVPEIPPGEQTELVVRMAVPETAGEYRYNWQIEMGTQAMAPNEFPLVVTDLALAESPHPYAVNMNYEYPIDNPDVNAVFTQIHFTQIEVEQGWDFVTVETPNHVIINKYTGNHTDIWSSAVPGRQVIVRLESDNIVTGYGFLVDQLQSVEASRMFLPKIYKHPTQTPTFTPTPTATPTATPTPKPTPTSFVICTCNTVDVCTCNLVCVCEAVCSCDGYCSCDSYCTCDTVHYWYPN